ncbi:MAG: hypothetical protein WB239_16280, partial [Acidimicrobiia bacterium]
SAGYVVKRVADADHHVTTTEVVVAAPDPGADDLVDELGFGHVMIGQLPAGVDAIVILGEDAVPVS